MLQAQKWNFLLLDVALIKLPILPAFPKSSSLLIQFMLQEIFLILLPILFKIMLLLFLKNFESSFHIIRRTRLNSGSILANVTGLFTKWLTKRPNHSISSLFSHTNLHEILIRNLNMMTSLIDKKITF